MVYSDIECIKCNNRVPFHRRSCHVCEESIGFPNVRLAEYESDGLLERYNRAYGAAGTKAVTDILHDFEKIVDKAQVVISKPINKVIELISNDNQMLQTLYKEVSGNARLADNNSWDTSRQSVDSAINPNYVDKIHCAVLSVNNYGVSYYGKCQIKLKSSLIQNRTTFFEENPFIFFKKHRHITGEEVPAGYRSTWANRSKLAVAKLHSKITKNTVASDFPKILIHDDGEESDFIEAHIYGSVHAKLFENITVVNPDVTEKVLLNAYKKKMSENGIQLTVE